MTMGDLARLYGVHVGTARRWARQDGWTRARTRPMRYLISDAQASYDRRHSGRIARHLLRLYQPAA
jgi:uncharacterized protein YjcR